MRTEHDALGSRDMEDTELTGINTQRARENFALDNGKVNLHLIHAMVMVKKACALTFAEQKVREEGIYEAIAEACDDILTGSHDRCFDIEALQGGAGTSTNMCVNEVICNLALTKLGKTPGQYDIIHPLDDVNRGQSTNDVYPTALRIAAILRLRELSDECARLQTALQKKENLWKDVDKLGRTELMDAVKVSLGEEFGCYAQAIARDRWRIYKVEERLRQMNLGGTAVGRYDNASRAYRFRVVEKIRELTGIGLAEAEYPMDLTQNNDVFVEVSGLLDALAVNLQKIANDLRLMNSGPYGGIGELRLPELQQGSSIMPGKVNPVIPEMVIQCSIRVMANGEAIKMAASHGEFELNAFLPLIANSLLESLQLLIRATYLFRTKAIEPLTCNERACARHLRASYAFATSYTPMLGYDTVSRIVKDHEPAEAQRILEDLTRNHTNGDRRE